MSSEQHPLSNYNKSSIPDASKFHFAVVVSQWNSTITDALMNGCTKILQQSGTPKNHIHLYPVPGSFELSTAAAWLAQQKEIDAIICLGCVIQGHTRHFDFICQAVANGLTQVGIQSGKPVVFGVLTTNDQTQAEERSGGRLGNKGEEAAVTAIKMLDLKKSI
ncbi:MAG: 6,7-dimethyl-8-ribityllumazine synthase [Bacteroidales bacterium]